jgi:hypothetical protein
MWEPRRLTILWASAACYRDSFTFLPYLILNLIDLPKVCVDTAVFYITLGKLGSPPQLLEGTKVSGRSILCYDSAAHFGADVELYHAGGGSYLEQATLRMEVPCVRLRPPVWRYCFPPYLKTFLNYDGTICSTVW